MPSPMLRLPLAVSLFAATASFAVAQDPPGYRTPRSFEPPTAHAPSGPYGQRWLVELQGIPAAWLTLDADEDEVERSVTAYGQGLRLAVGNRDQSIGALYQGFDSGDGFSLHALSFDVDVRRQIDDGTGLFFVKVGAGFGGAAIDDGGEQATELTAQLRLGIDFQPTRSLLLGASLGAVGYGHPGETVAYGGLFAVTLGVVF